MKKKKMNKKAVVGRERTNSHTHTQHPSIRTSKRFFCMTTQKYISQKKMYTYKKDINKNNNNKTHYNISAFSFFLSRSHS